MPRYSYKCGKCLEEFEVTHSYKELQEECLECGTIGQLNKILSDPINIRNRTTNKKKQVGSAVNKAIEDNKEKLKEEKRKLRNRS